MRFMTFAAACCAVSLITVSHGFAQERAAGGTLDTQITWTALSDMAKAASDKAAAVNTRVDQIVVCGKNGRIYAPGGVGADASGCMEAKAADGTTITTINNNLKTTNINLTATNVNVANIIACNMQMKFYDGTKCVDLPFQKETEYVESNGWMSSPYTLACTLDRKISYAMLNVTTKSNQLACGRSGANCDGNATSTLLGKTKWMISPDRGKYVSAYIECK